MIIDYHASKTCAEFHKDMGSSVRALMGPIGSGKSVACCWEVFKLCQQQQKGHDGFRRSRWAIIRNTYRELHDTTIKTFHDWFPQNMGKWKVSDSTQTWEFGDIKAEILFRALDRPDDVKKLLSLELTGAFVNEAREIPWAVIKMVRGRIGRYPSKRDGGPSWYGLIMDTNPPDEDHWWYKRFEEDKPEGWKLYRQPSALSPDAENIDNLPKDYYTTMQQGADEEWVKVYVKGEYGFIQEGKPVWPQYIDSIHCASDVLEYDTGKTLYIGIDFGLTPAAVFMQETVGGQFRVIDEIITEDMGAVRFSRLIKKQIAKSRCKDVEITADPAGDQRAQTDEKTPFDVMAAQGVIAYPADTNDPLIRIEAVTQQLQHTSFDGSPAFLISPSCRKLRKAMSGGYHYRRVQVSGDERFQDKPDKTMSSHVADALQYCMLGAGAGNAVVGIGLDSGYSASNFNPEQFESQRLR